MNKMSDAMFSNCKVTCGVPQELALNASLLYIAFIFYTLMTSLDATLFVDDTSLAVVNTNLKNFGNGVKVQPETNKVCKNKHCSNKQ